MTSTSSESDFPQLRSAIANYVLPGKEDFLVLEYQKRGEDDLEFSGLADELQHAAKRPQDARALFAEELGFTGPEQEIREACIELYNRLKGVGTFDKTKQEKVEGEELFMQTAGRQLTIAGRPIFIGNRPVPLGGAFAAFLLIGLLGYVLNRYVPWPSWLSWFPTVFQGIAFFGLAFTSAALIMLRSEIRDPARAERRRKMIEAARERREGRKGQRDNWFKRNMTF